MRRKVRAHMLAVADVARDDRVVVEHRVHRVHQHAGMDRLVVLVRRVLRREARAQRGLRLGHLLQERIVARPLVIAEALEQRVEKELGIGDALVLAAVARFGDVVEADEDEILSARALAARSSPPCLRAARRRARDRRAAARRSQSGWLRLRAKWPAKSGCVSGMTPIASCANTTGACSLSASSGKLLHRTLANDAFARCDHRRPRFHQPLREALHVLRVGLVHDGRDRACTAAAPRAASWRMYSL